MSERKEAWMRILVAIVSGIILAAWGSLIKVLMLINFLIGVFANKRNKDIAEFAEIWNTQAYVFVRYMNFVTNFRPFPWNGLQKNMSKFGK